MQLALGIAMCVCVCLLRRLAGALVDHRALAACSCMYGRDGWVYMWSTSLLAWKSTGDLDHVSEGGNSGR